MDSTAFSIHFRSLARSDSGGDVKTPTGVHLSLEDKTPTRNAIATNPGSSMVLTAADKPISFSCIYDYGRLSPRLDALLAEGSKDLHSIPISANITVSKSPVKEGSRLSPEEQYSGSIQQNNNHGYDFGRLSPRWDALLAEGSKDLRSIPVSDNRTISKSPIKGDVVLSPDRQHSGPLKQIDNVDKEIATIGDAYGMPAEAAYSEDGKLSDRNGAHNLSPVCNTTSVFLSDMPNAPTSEASVYKQRRSSDPQTEGIPSSIHEGLDAFDMGKPDVDPYSANGTTPSNVASKGLQLAMFAQRGCESPLVGSISSFSAKRRRIILNSCSPLKNLLAATPSPKKSGSLVTDEIRKHYESVSSIHKSISRLKMLDASPLLSTFKVKLDSTLAPSELVFNTPPHSTVQNRNREEAEVKLVNNSVAFDDQSANLGKESGEAKVLIKMDCDDVEALENMLDVNQGKGSAVDGKAGISTCLPSTGILCNEKDAPSQSILSGKKAVKNLSVSEDTSGGIVVPSGTDPFTAGILLDHVKEGKVTVSLQKSLFSPAKNMEKRSLTASPGNSGNGFSRDLELYDHHNKVGNVNSGHGADSSESVTTTSLPEKLSNRLDSLFTEKVIDPFKEVSGVEATDGRSINLHGLEDDSEAIGNSQSSLAASDTQKFQSLTSDGVGTDPMRLKKALSGGGIKAASHVFVSPCVNRGDNEPPIQKKLEELFSRSPSRKEFCNATHSDRFHSFVAGDAVGTNQLTNGSDRIPVQKRGREEMIPGDGDIVEETASIWRSSKLRKSEKCDSEFLGGLPNENNDETIRVEHEMRLQRLADAFSKFSADATKFISPSIVDLKVQAIGALEDVLANLQKVQKYEMLLTDIRSQKSSDTLSNLHHKRAAELKNLVHKIIHERAKLQLMHVKREKLQKKVQLLNSGIQESQMLKLNSLPRLSLPCLGDIHACKVHLHSSANLKDSQDEGVAGDKINSMKQEVDILERKIMSLTKSFCTYCNIKGEPSSDDAIVLVNDHLKKKASFRLVRLDFQLWEVEGLESTSVHHNITLNYLDFVIQRFTICVGPVSSMVIANDLKHVNILKNFPKMDVCTAFEFALNANATRKYAGPASLTQETQITSSVLGNLLDVVKEVQMAHVEIRNLTDTSFHLPYGGWLELHLCFIDFKSGRKVTLTFDMSCLKWGIYPSDIIPLQFEGTADMSEKSLPDLLTAEIRAAVQNVRFGYRRIIHICECVSKVLQA
ncbi:hypothetical protein NMG60_11003300 [Bertholletia excelsa]